MIISGGENVYCAEVERVLVEAPGVLEAAVIGLPDPVWGELVTAVLVARPGQRLDEAAVVDHCRTELAGYKCPRRVEVVAELPGTRWARSGSWSWWSVSTGQTTPSP